MAEVLQASFISAARSLNEEDLRKNLPVFKFLQAGIETIRSRLAMKIYDEYANILRGMYSGTARPSATEMRLRLKTSRAPERPFPQSLTFLRLGAHCKLAQLGHASQKRSRNEYN